MEAQDVVERIVLAVRHHREPDGAIVLDLHESDTADDCVECRWHLTLRYDADDPASLRSITSSGVDVPHALRQLRKSAPLEELSRLALGCATLRAELRVLGGEDAFAVSGQQYIPYGELVAVLITAPPKRELRELRDNGAPWGVAPTRLVAAYYHVSTTTAGAWMRRQRRTDVPAAG